jgi:hypothetical protein
MIGRGELDSVTNRESLLLLAITLVQITI